MSRLSKGRMRTVYVDVRTDGVISELASRLGINKVDVVRVSLILLTYLVDKGFTGIDTDDLKKYVLDAAPEYVPELTKVLESAGRR